MDWKKEYRLSDLFRREAKPEALEPDELDPQAEQQIVEPEPSTDAPTEATKQSVMKKKIHLFGRRKAKEAEPVEEATPEPPASEEPAVEPSAEFPDTPAVHQIVESEPSTDAPTEATKKSVMKKEIHLFGRRKAKEAEPVEEATPEPPSTDPVSAADDRSSETVSGWSQPESASSGQPGAAEHPSVGPEAELPDQPEAPDRAESPGVGEAAAALAAAHAVSHSPSDEQPDSQAEPEFAADPDPATAANAEGAERTGRRFGRRAGPKDAEQGERGGPDRRESPSRRDRSTEERIARAEARGGKPAALPDVPLFHAINLLPREEAKARRQGPSLQQLSVAVIGLVMLGMLSFVFVLQRARVEDRQAEVQRLQADLAEIQSTQSPDTGSSTTEVAGELVTRAGTLSVVIDGRIVWDRLLRQLSLVLPPDVWFDGVTSSVGTTSTTTTATSTTSTARASTLTIKGYARTQQGVAELLGRLGVMPEFDLVQLQSGQLVDLGDEKVVQFSVAATLKPEGGVAS